MKQENLRNLMYYILEKLQTTQDREEQNQLIDQFLALDKEFNKGE